MDVVIDPRYNGPPQSGNGGYSAGRFWVASASLLSTMEYGAEVTLRVPPPLAVPLAVNTDEEGTIVTDPQGGLVATLRSARLTEDEVVAPVSWDDAVEASTHYPGFAAHPFPTCFVCGPERAPGDGLRLFPGRLADGRTATPFLVPDEISPELVWAALDCPGGWAVLLEGRPYVLGRIAARIVRRPRAGQRAVVMGAVTREEGRKAFTMTSLYGQDGGLLATARSTWIAVS